MFDNSPYFNQMNSSVAESIADKVIFNSKISYDSVIDDLNKLRMVKPIKGTIDYVVSSVNEATDSTRSVLTGSLIAAAANFGIVYIARKYYNGDAALVTKFLNDVSFWSETAIYSVGAGVAFWFQQKKEGVPALDRAYHLLRFGATGAAISFSMYKPAKGEMTNFISNTTGIDPEYSSSLTQLSLMFPFALAVALLRKPMGFAIDKTTKSLTDTKDYIVTKGQKIANDFKNGKS